jgi:hypothetical protein
MTRSFCVYLSINNLSTIIDEMTPIINTQTIQIIEIQKGKSPDPVITKKIATKK